MSFRLCFLQIILTLSGLHRYLHFEPRKMAFERFRLLHCLSQNDIIASLHLHISFGDKGAVK
jgi:hypothetical protein